MPQQDDVVINEFDKLMQILSAKRIIAFVRNCEVGTLGNIPATFNYKYSAAIQWLKKRHMSRMETTEADGNTPTEALRNAVQKAGLNFDLASIGETNGSSIPRLDGPDAQQPQSVG